MMRPLFRFAFAFVAVALASVAVAAESLDQLEQKAFRAAVDRVAPSVVQIETVGGLEKVGELVVGTGPTTGLIVDKDGFILSSLFNFVHKPSSILVQLPDGGRKPARLVATDHNRKLVLLKIDVEKPLPAPEIAPQKELRVGQWTIGVGRTFHGAQPNMSVGVLSATNRIWGKAVQTDAAVSPNNYGGPLVDLQGRVIGVLVPLSPEGSTDIAGIEWYDSGIGFAVPAEFILTILPKLKEGKDLEPGLMGINLNSRALHTAEPVIASTRPLSPAGKAGFKSGDKIVEIDGRPITRAANVKEEISRRYAGDKMKVAVLRESQRIEAELELVAELEQVEIPFLGVLPLRPVSDDERQKPGLRVRYVYPDSPAAKAGIKPGDVVAKLSKEEIRDLRRLRTKMAEAQPGEEAQFEIRHGEETKTLKIELAKLPTAIPPSDVPPAHEPAKPEEKPAEKPKEKPEVKPAEKDGDAEKPKPFEKEKTEKPKELQKGAFKLEGDDIEGEVWAYVPEGYNKRVAHGLVIWLHGSEGFDGQKLAASWKPLCDRYDLILVAPKSQTTYWRSRDWMDLRPVLTQLARGYAIDPLRVVVAGRESGGSLACLTAFNLPRVIQAVVTIDGPLAGRMPEQEAPTSLPFFVGRSQKSRVAGAVEETLGRLKELKYPVTLKELGPQPRDLTDEELGEIARWIDALDRI